ncbi:MAG: ferritin family protein, partial [Phycisphaerae bacterium]|nr:ferritin family protein [Phycisphaerae bacterium]
SGTPINLGIAGTLSGSKTLARLVLDAAAEFETTVMRRYMDLADSTDNPRLRALLTDLVAEEQCHLAQVRELRIEHGTTQLPIVRAAAEPPTTTSLELANGDREFMLAAIEHEQAVADFYTELARNTPATQLRTALQRLADDEVSHAKRLRVCLGDA